MIYIKASDGVGLAVYDYNSCSEKTVVMIHGWPLSNKIFEYQLENSGHGIMYDQLKKFNDIFICSVNDGFKDNYRI